MRKCLTILIFILASLVGKSQSSWITISDSIVYDLSGATRKGSPGAYLYFASNNSADGRITRNVADFNRDSLGGKGWKVFINLQREYTLATDSAIKFYDPSGSVDTIDLFLFDKDNAPKWDTIINTEDYTPTYRITSCGTCSGLPITSIRTSPAGRKVQFILAIIHRTNLFSGLWPNIRAIQFKGTPTGNADTTYNLAHWAFNSWTAKPIDSIVGNFNLPNQQDTLWHDTATAGGNYGYFRSFDRMFYDDQNVPHGSQQINLGGGGYTAYKYNAALARRGNYQFAVVFDNNAYFNAQQSAAGHGTTVGWGTNTFTDDPQLPASYSRKGYYMHALALIGGGCTTCPSVRTYNGTLVKGQGYLKGLGTTNEATLFAFANAWKTPIEVAAEAIGVYDSVKLGDPNMPVFVGAYEAYNYDDAKATIMLMKLYARSRNIKTDGVAFHGIHSLKTDSFSVIPTTDQQIGNHGVSPGYWDDWHKNIHFVQGLRREAGNTNLLVQLDEDTHQKGVYKRSPASSGETYSVSQLAAPRFTVNAVTLDAYKSHAVAALQDEFIASASPLYKHYWYQIVDGEFSTSNPNYDAIDQNNGKFDKPADYTDHPESWPADYATVSRKRRVGKYRFVDSVFTEYRGRHVFKYKNVNNPDSLMFEGSILDSTGTGSYTITGLNATSAKLITYSFTSRIATEQDVAIIGGQYSLSLGPMPKALIVYSPPSSGNASPTANAGTGPISITLPTSSVTLNGTASSDPDGTIAAYAWSKTSGPSSYNIVSPSSATTNVTSLSEGTYVFTLTVTDNDGAIDSDTIIVVVQPSYRRVLRLNRKLKIHN